MNHSLHHFRALCLRFRAAILCYILAWVALACMAWLLPQEPYWSRMNFGMHLALTGLGAALFGCALAQDPAAGSDSFWRTRPAGWGALWRSQMLFLALVAAPPLLCWAANGLLMDNSIRQWIYGASDAGLILSAFFILAGIASFATNWHSFLLVMACALIAGWCSGWVKVVAEGMILESLSPQSRHLSHGMEHRRVSLYIFGAALSALAAWLWGMRCMVRRKRILGIAALSLILPPGMSLGLGWLATEREPAVPLPVTIRELHGGKRNRGCSVHFLQVPPGQRAVLTRPELECSEWDAGYPGSHSRIASWSWASGLQDVTSGEALREWFSPELAWHTTTGRPSASLGILDVVRHTNGDLHLSGTVHGVLMAPVKLLSLPLTQGATKSARGSRLHIRKFANSGGALELLLDLHSAAVGEETVLPDWVPFTGQTEQRRFFVLHFPAAGFAVLCEAKTSREHFASWQTRLRTCELGLQMPLEKAVRGIQFDQSTLNGAEIVLFGLQAQREVIGKVSGPVLPAPHSATPLAEPAPVSVPHPADALSLVRNSRVPLHARVITAAAREAKPADYEYLTRMVRMLPRPLHQARSILGDTDDAHELFMTLKSLSDFDWRSLAVDHWNRLREPGANSERAKTKTPDIEWRNLQLWAALAGDAVAFNKIAERESLAETDAKTGKLWAELAAMVEGIPADGPERKAWLLRRWGYFTFDEAAGRYRVRPDLPAE